MTESSHSEFQCAICWKTFTKKGSDEERDLERTQNDFDEVECGIVCDGCYKRGMLFIEAESKRMGMTVAQYTRFMNERS